MRRRRRAGWAGLVAAGLSVAVVGAQESAGLRDVVARVTAPFVAEAERFAYRVRGRAEDVALSIELDRFDGESFRLRVETPWVRCALARNAGRTLLVLPEHGVAFVGEGGLGPKDDSLAPAGFLSRLLRERAPLVSVGRALLLGRIGREDEGKIDSRTVIRLVPGDDSAVAVVSDARGGIVGGVRRLEVRARFDDRDLPAASAGDLTEGLEVREVPRAELERVAFRALRRLLEMRVPGLAPRASMRPAKVEHGELRVVDGQRLVLLTGDPREIGAAHGRLLGDVVRRTVDSSLYLVGFGETARTGEWFPGVLARAWQRLSPHIPDAHRVEMDALADAVPGLSRRELRLANVFPEYFHCSGFALFGSATKDGKLYHARVLDYMTVIGLQQAAVTFVVRPRRGFAFLNVGYAGFVGSVTGMNERAVSVGEMGGRGRFDWDGAPMATLMRRALEECATLEQVEDLWRAGPRTCEYFYVFADGDERRAVGVRATPREIEFVRPGETHPLLGEGIADTVLLSAGNRLRTLRERVVQAHGEIDTEAAIRLMDRPVAMRSNLHSVLMVPEDGVAFVAQAGPDTPAVETPYARFDFRALLTELGPGAARTFLARDTLAIGDASSPETREMLARFAYEPSAFDVEVAERRDERGDWSSVVTFPSPKPRPKDDRAALEWYAARGIEAGASAPAVVVLHILDGRMRIARTFARGFANRGIHAFVLHLPGYGRRETARGSRRDPRAFLDRSVQGVADARRARDAIAALPGVDATRIAIQGTSLGGFVAALAAALDHGFDRTFLVLAGGDLESMFQNGERDTAKLRRAILAAGTTEPELADMLRAIDPARIASRLDPQTTWLYSASLDRVIPRENAKALARAANLDDHHHLWFSGDHYTSAVHLPAIARHIAARIE